MAANSERMASMSEKASQGSFRTIAILALLVLASSDNSFDFALFNVALPKIAAEFQTTPAIAQWAISVVYLAFGATVMVGGKLLDMFGERRMLLLSIATIFVGAAIGFLAQNMGVLVIGRCLQGVGRAILNPGVLLLVTREFDGKQRSAAIAVALLVQTVSAPIGMMLGVWEVNSFGWRSVQALSLSVCVALFPLALAVLRQGAPSAERARTAIDYPGAALSAIAVAALVFGATQVPLHGIVSLPGGGALLLGIVAAAALPAIERRQAEPILPASIFRLPNVTPSLLAVAIIPGGMAGMITLAIVTLQELHHHNGVESGLILAPLGIGAIIAKLLTGWAVSRFPAKRLIVAGFVCVIAGDIWLYALVDRTSDLVAMIPPLFVCGVVPVIGIVTAIAETMHPIPPEERGVGSALVYAAQQISTAVNVALVLTTLALFAQADGLDRDAVGAGWLVAAALVTCGLVYSGLKIKGAPPRQFGPAVAH
jgi:MFS family permease